MEKFQIQFIVGPFTINHLTESSSLEAVKTKYFSDYKNKKSSGELWALDDSLLDPSAISMVRILPFTQSQGEDESVQ